MKLTYRRFSLKLAHRWTIASKLGPGGGGGDDQLEVLLVELRDEKGRIGMGETAPSSRYNENVDTSIAFLKHIDPNRLSFGDAAGSMQYLDAIAAGGHAPKCALNIALLDGAAKRAGKPIYDFLDLGFSEEKHLTSFSIGIDSPSQIRHKTKEAKSYPVLKLKVGSSDDKENFGALRAAAPGKAVRLDANEAWKTKEEALEHLETLARDAIIQFVEQPMPADAKSEDLKWLKDRSPLPIFADESYRFAEDLPRCVDAFHGVNVKLVKAGGINGAQNALVAARKAGLNTMIGCMIETSVLISAAAHLAELADYLDIDGNLLVTNDPYVGVSARNGIVSFKEAPEPLGLRVAPRPKCE